MNVQSKHRIMHGSSDNRTAKPFVVGCNQCSSRGSFVSASAQDIPETTRPTDLWTSTPALTSVRVQPVINKIVCPHKYFQMYRCFFQVER